MARRGAIGLRLGLVVLAGCAAGSADVARSTASASFGSAASAGSTGQATWTPWPAGSAAVIPIPTALPSEITHDQAMRLFQYHRSRPFDIKETAADALDGATVHDITYVGAAGTRYQPNLVLPTGPGPFGGVMYLHGAGRSSSDFLSEATALARRGVAPLLITQPEAQEVPDDGNAAVTEIVYEMREMGRAMDLLASRPEVDPSRLGFVGFSFGAVGGATFAGFQSGRLRIAVLASTPPSYDTPAMSPSTRSYGSRTFLRPPSPSRRASWTPGSPTTRARP